MGRHCHPALAAHKARLPALGLHAAAALILLCPTMLLCAMTCGCGRHAGQPTVPGADATESHYDTPGGTAGPAPALSELQQRLAAEFARLGIDPDKVAASAPAGDENAVFDLGAQVLDPDGPPDGQGGGEQPPTGIELTWTEQLVGDYDQNGEVNAADLTPVSVYWNESVSYDAPALHGGCPGWPSGDPEDDGLGKAISGRADLSVRSSGAARDDRPPHSRTAAGGPPAPPAEGSGAANWRRARVDGDANGLIYIYEISPIASHWKQTITGYRVYRRGPGESSFSMMTLPGGPADCTLSHGSPPTPQHPLRYSLTDSEATPSGLGDGVYAYYVAPYYAAPGDPASAAQGPPSGVINVNIQSGVVNHAPVAVLTVTPDFGGAPAVITLDASGSYDIDGSIAAYRWDFDGDGAWDWLSTDPLPPQSSDGTVTEITQGVTPGIITATYTQGSAQWLYPRVAVVDNEAAASSVATAKLGISGWVSEILNDSLEDYKISVYPDLISVEPGTGRIVAVASATISEFTGTSIGGLWYLRQTDSGPWEMETIEVPFELSEYETPGVRELLWDEYDQPLITFEEFNGKCIWTAQRRANGAWEVQSHAVSSIPGSTIRNWITFSGASEPGKLARLVYERLGDRGSYYGGDWHNKLHMLFYDHGEWRFEYTGYDDADSPDQLTMALGVNASDLRCYYRVIGTLTGGPWEGVWQDGLGFGNPVRLGAGLVSMGTPHSNCKQAIMGLDGARITLWEDGNDNAHRQFWLLRDAASGLDAYNLTELSLDPPYEARSAKGLYESQQGTGVFLTLVANEDTIRSQHWLLKDGQWTVEIPMQPYFSTHDPPSFEGVTTSDTGATYALLADHRTQNEKDFANTYFLAERVDPRVGE